MTLLIDTPTYKLRYSGTLRIQTRDELLASETEREWQYVPRDHNALEEIACRLGRAARARTTLTYGALVKDIAFCVSTTTDGLPYRPNMNVGGNAVVRKKDLEMVDEFLTYLSLHSYKGGNLIASALVTGPGPGKPSSEFLRLARKLRRSTPRLTSDTELWRRELQCNFDYFAELK